MPLRAALVDLDPCLISQWPRRTVIGTAERPGRLLAQKGDAEAVWTIELMELMARLLPPPPIDPAI